MTETGFRFGDDWPCTCPNDHTISDFCPRHTLSVAIATERRLNAELRRVNHRLNAELRQWIRDHENLVAEINTEHGFDS